MNLDEIREILELVREHELSEFELEREGMAIRIKKVHGSVQVVRDAESVRPPEPSAGTSPPAAAPVAAASASVSQAPEAGQHIVTSPIVGTLYRASEPGAPPFVDVGQHVKKGQVLCIIEAMKLMNEIDADCDGEVVAIYVENGQPVQYGDRLFAVKTA